MLCICVCVCVCGSDYGISFGGGSSSTTTQRPATRTFTRMQQQIVASCANVEFDDHEMPDFDPPRSGTTAPVMASVPPHRSAVRSDAKMGMNGDDDDEDDDGDDDDDDDFTHRDRRAHEPPLTFRANLQSLMERKVPACYRQSPLDILQRITITSDERATATRLLTAPPTDTLVFDKFERINVTQRDLSCLAEKSWISGTVLRLYLNLLLERHHFYHVHNLHGRSVRLRCFTVCIDLFCAHIVVKCICF